MKKKGINFKDRTDSEQKSKGTLLQDLGCMWRNVAALLCIFSLTTM